MRDFVILFVHLVVTVVRLALPGGLRSVVAESLLVKHQLLILNRGRKRAVFTPPLRAPNVSRQFRQHSLLGGPATRLRSEEHTSEL